MWTVNILTLVPEVYPGILGKSISGKKLKSGLWSLKVKNIRDFTNDTKSRVDDTPFGGGKGMLLRPDVLGEAIEQFFLKNTLPIIYPSPRGVLLTKHTAKSFVKFNKGINILCGRFEGVDERIITEYSIKELSIGDYVLSSGDIASFVIIDCCLRHLTGYLGNKNSLQEESLGEGTYENLLEYPQFTRPRVWKNKKIPKVLVSGNHKKIYDWRLCQSKKRTKDNRPDLWYKHIKKEKE